jgi:hypothetical protein
MALLLLAVLLAAVVTSGAQHEVLAGWHDDETEAQLLPWGPGRDNANVVQRCGRHFCLGDVRFSFVGTYVRPAAAW